MLIPRRLPAYLVVCAVASLSAGSIGCLTSSTFQASSNSSSDSSKSSSQSASRSVRSSSDSSDSDDQTAADVREATALWLVDDGNVDALRREVGRITTSHGVTDWEADPSIYQAIGAGLRNAHVTPREYERIRTELAGGEAKVSGWIQQGYDAAAPAP